MWVEIDPGPKKYPVDFFAYFLTLSRNIDHLIVDWLINRSSVLAAYQKL